MKDTTLCFIPGTLCDERLWQLIWPQLGAQPRCHLPIPDGDSLDTLTRQLSGQLPDGPLALVGFSMGGYLAARLACALPQRVQSLILIANTPCALPTAEVQQREELLDSLARYGYRGISSQKCRQMVASSRRQDQALLERIRAMDAAFGEAGLIQQLSATTHRRDLGDELARLDLPIHFIIGDEDSLTNRSWLQHTLPRLSQATLSEVANCGHMLPLEQPQALLQLLQA